MEHWFDRFVKDLARGGVSRRDVVKLAFQGAVAAAAGSVFPVRAMARASSGRPVSPRPDSGSEQRGPCSFSRDGQITTLKYGVQSSVNGKPLTHECEITFDVGSTRGDAKSVKITSTTTVKLGDDPLLQIDRSSQGGSMQIKYSYGQAFQGVHEAAFTSDGKTVQGTVDDRAISPHPVGADASTIKYADGHPAPAIKLDSAISDALTSLLKQARDAVSTCKSAGASRSSSAPDSWFQSLALRRGVNLSRSRPAVEIASLSPAALALAPSTFGALQPLAALEGAGEGFGMGQIGGSGCTDCQNDCAGTYAECEAAAGGGCLVAFLCPPCGAACEGTALIACSITGAECLSNCNNAGSACCPIGCSNGNCCNSGQQCTPNGGCCPDGVEICNNQCCSPGQVCKNGVCCTSDRNVCHGVCCPEGNVCSTEDICCPSIKSGEKPISCGSACCPEGQNCAKSYAGSKDEICCYTERICGGVCCPSGCVNGNECAPLCLVGESCGSSCCDWGCADSKTSTCKPAQNCAKGQYVCTGEAAGVVNVCCPNGTGCHNAKCCPTNTTYCTNVTTGVAGCWPSSQCYVPPPPK
ncbi:MAG: hypothetical protein WBP85_11750 [Terracidiphilus sp.]